MGDKSFTVCYTVLGIFLSAFVISFAIVGIVELAQGKDLINILWFTPLFAAVLFLCCCYFNEFIDCFKKTNGIQPYPSSNDNAQEQPAGLFQDAGNHLKQSLLLNGMC